MSDTPLLNRGVTAVKHAAENLDPETWIEPTKKGQAAPEAACPVKPTAWAPVRHREWGDPGYALAGTIAQKVVGRLSHPFRSWLT